MLILNIDVAELSKLFSTGVLEEEGGVGGGGTGYLFRQEEVGQ